MLECQPALALPASKERRSQQSMFCGTVPLHAPVTTTQFSKHKVVNMGFDEVNLLSILRKMTVTETVSTYFKEKEVHMISFWVFQEISRGEWGPL